MKGATLLRLLGAILGLAALFSSFSSTTAQTATGDTCKAVSISCPISGGCTVTSKFAPSRVNPVTGKTERHPGVDYAASNGTSVLAAATGTIEQSYTSTSYGNVIVVRHQDGGATLYAHLKLSSVKQGDAVTSGQKIGEADSTGTSTASHLHFEYVPNGKIIQSPNRIDPAPCVGKTVNGSISVGDNGNIADDAFQVAIDGFVIGQTTIGATNNLAANNLTPGTHTLTITCTTAPDNDGTLGVTLSNGLKFSDGSLTRAADLTLGQSVMYQIIVPTS